MASLFFPFWGSVCFPPAHAHLLGAALPCAILGRKPQGCAEGAVSPLRDASQVGSVFGVHALVSAVFVRNPVLCSLSPPRMCRAAQLMAWQLCLLKRRVSPRLHARALVLLRVVLSCLYVMPLCIFPCCTGADGGLCVQPGLTLPDGNHLGAVGRLGPEPQWPFGCLSSHRTTGSASPPATGTPRLAYRPIAISASPEADHTCSWIWPTSSVLSNPLTGKSHLTSASASQMHLAANTNSVDWLTDGHW